MGFVRELRLVARGWRWTQRSLTPRSAVPHTSPPPRREFPTAWARTRPAQVVRAGIHRFGLTPLVWTETRPRVYGLDHLDGLDGPVVFVSNHSSHLDAPLFLGALPPRWRDRVAVGAAADYFFDARWRAAATALAFNAFPVERRAARDAATTAHRLLDDGWSLLLFPEGTRSQDGWMDRFRHGAARLCLERGVPAVPLVIRGAYAAMPRGRRWTRPGRPPVALRFGPAVWPEEGEFARAFSGRLAAAVTRLWDEEDTTWWDSLRRQERGEPVATGGPDAPRWRRVWESSRALGSRSSPRVWR